MKHTFLKAAVLAIGVLALSSLPATSQAFDTTYGIGSYLSTRFNTSNQNTIISEMQMAGIRWTRIEICYTTGTEFEGDVNALNALNGTGIRVIGLLNDCSGLPSVDDWGNFVDRAVQRFNSQVAAWEIMNEPYGEGMSAGSYKDYLHRSYQKIKAVNNNAIVLADVNPQFLYELYKVNGAKDAFDSVAVHPYKDRPPEEIEEGGEDFLGSLRRTVAVIKANGGGKRVWLTEFGRQSGVGRGDQQQADYQVRSAMIARDLPEVEIISLYHVKDDGTGNYGMLRTDFTRKDAYDRLQEMLGQIEGRSYSGQVLIADQQRVDDFTTFDNWDTREQANTTRCEARHDSGREGKGMRLYYAFNSNSGSAYCSARKEIPIPGAPTTIGLWIDGDNSSNIWRMRIKDATDQVHQLMLGTFPSGWRYVRYDLVNAEARSHWGGANDGVIHYPIRFDSILIDRLGERGYYEGSAYLDDLFVLHGAGDYWGYRFGNKVAAWRTSFDGEATVCGTHMRINERPTYVTVNPNDCPAMYSFR
ncbi:hypothetical protein HYW32_00560 [Candidatus Berkelbacteria bacterium]|nr:hypothetical protein [Candidatus Berkelbacteria bacterium]